MQARHVPTINARYWAGITFASIFGTNMGDFYAHESGLGLLGGLPILVALFLAVYAVERVDRMTHDAWYWLCIVVMRTGATNIADYLAGRRGLAIDRVSLSIGLGLALAALAWWAARADRARSGGAARKGVPDTDARYWTAMLVAGVFGTVLGDLCEHAAGEGAAALGLGGALVLALLAYRQGALRPVLAYWLTVGVARTTGTAVGDWLAEDKMLGIGLPLCTLLTGFAFVAVLVLARGRRPAESP
jgi:uncharacterized membrane-anchored protein